MTDDDLKSLFAGLRQEMLQELGAMRQETGALRQEMLQGLGAMRQETGALRQEMRQETGALRQEMSQELGAMRGELGAMRGELGAIRQETTTLRQEIVAVREENVAMHVETRRYFDIALEAARHETQLVAENVGGLRETINRLDDKVTAIAADLDLRVTRLEVASSKR